MSIETSSAIIIVLIFLLIIQISVLFIIRKLISKLSVLIKEVNTAKIKLSYKNIIPNKTLMTCHNCHFRQTFFRSDIEGENAFFYRCKVYGIEINLEDSCNKFELETSKTK
jgi:hypothetical protein